MGPLDEDTPRWSPSGAPRECNGANLAVLEPPESADAAASAEGRALSAARRDSRSHRLVFLRLRVGQRPGRATEESIFRGRMKLELDLQLVRDVADGGERVCEIFARVRRGDAKAYPGIRHRRRRCAHHHHREFTVERQAREIPNLVRLVEHHGHHRGWMVPENLEAERLESLAEKFRVVSKLAELRRADVGAVLAGDDAEGRENLRAHGGGHGHGVGAPRGVLSDARHRLVVAGDVPPGRAERFREGAHHDVDVGGVDAELLAHAATGGTDGADGVRLIEPDVRAVHLAHPDDVRKATQLALHAVDALDDDQNLVVSRTLAGDGVLEDELQVPDAVVLEGADFRAGETRALDDGVVVERVRNDEVAGAADGGDDGGVGGETHTHHHGSLLAHESRRGLLHLLHRGAVPELRAGSAAGDGVIADRLHDERRAVGVQTAETEVIVRAEVQASSRLRRGDELTEEPALGLGRADGDVDPILGEEYTGRLKTSSMLPYKFRM